MKDSQHPRPCRDRFRPGPRGVTVPLGIALAMSAAIARAEPVEFADDFSAESLRFTVDRRPNDRSVRTYEVLDDRVTMTVSAVTDDD